MNPTQTLPATYRKIGTLDASKSERLPLVLTLVGLVVLVFAGWLFFRALIALRPEDALRILQGSQTRTIPGWIGLIAAILALIVLHIILHEAIHGVFFWIFTRTRPKFAFRLTYVYASAPDWYIPRNLFLITELAPLAVLTLAGLALFSIAPAVWLAPTWLVITINAGGAAGDLAVAGWLLLQPPTCLAQDRGDAVTLFKPGNGE